MVRELVTRVYLVRHGETEENRKKIIQGQLDTMLNDVGIQQADALAERLKEYHFDVAYTSDLSRVVETAKRVLEYHPNVPVHRTDALRERDLGAAQGKSHAQRRTLPASAIESAEPRDAFVARAVGWWREYILGRVPEGPQNILVITHGGVINALARALVSGKGLGSRDSSGQSFENARGAKIAEGVSLGWCANGSIMTVEVDECGQSGTEIVMYNDIAHLVDAGLQVVTSNADEADEYRKL
ncbi:phosphoglycerate mutase-like protein [Fistulina hepatica ATCC 64428]|nr:phosphoglycerate mutase-like protein [Fistulina hepatica ATCC 64428]